MIFNVYFPGCHKFLILLLGIMKFIALSNSEILYIFTSVLKSRVYFLLLIFLVHMIYEGNMAEL